ncbi:hypothetical protein [Haliangium sp.]|uniref:hypothetical protein n=1 Tax=Haliangium sp. TaxID=2663208 RepID=UPI003D10F66F
MSAMTPTPPPARAPRGRLIAAAALALVVLLAPAAHADKCKPGQAGDAETGQFRVEEQDGKKVYIIDKAITVCGKVPRPLVAYVLQPRSINYEWESLKQEFLPKIRESVEKAPF